MSQIMVAGFQRYCHHQGFLPFKMAGSASEPTVMDSEILYLKASKAKARELAQQLKVINKKKIQKRTIINAKKNLNEKQAHVNNRLTHKDHKQNVIINPAVRKLIQSNVLEKGMGRKAAAEAFKVSIRQVYRIIREDPNQKNQSKAPRKAYQRDGHESAGVH
jgi:hypothetical protein